VRRASTIESRVGATLVEVAVAVAVLSIGLALATRTLELAARELDGADLGVRALLLLSEIHDGFASREEVGARPGGPGLLLPSWDGDDLRVDYEPHAGGGREAVRGGYFERRSWTLPNRP